MKAGRLRHRIRIERQDQGVDAFGAPNKTWTQVAEVQASVDAISAREAFAAERDIGEETHRITIRELPDIMHLDGTYRAIDVDTGQQFDLRAVIENHTRNMITMTAKSGSSHS
jgi:head-tail adaptor